MTTIGVALQHAAAQLQDAGVDDARLEAEVLFAYALGIDRTHLLALSSDALPSDRIAMIESLLARRVRREPLAYITGMREFYGLNVACAPGALIPRPETEMIVEFALAEIRRRPDALRIVDVGTGSGAIAVAVAVNDPRAHITAVDASRRALSLARRNLDAHGVAHAVALREGDMIEGLGEIDLITANLPYVSDVEWNSLQPEVREWEPREAIVAGPRGIELNTRLLDAARSQLAKGGLLIAEIGAGQGDAMRDIARACFPGGDVCVKKDYAEHDRVLIVRAAGGTD